jgi:cell wall-associated NlpC family hydrolase
MVMVPSPPTPLPPGEGSERARVVAAARSWIGTPYHHAADVKGRKGGVDCAMLLVRVYCDLGLVEPFDPRPYTRDWMLHRDEEKYLGFLLGRAELVETPGPGDVILFKIGRCFAHGGVVSKTEPLTMIHAHAQAGFVVEDEVLRCPLSQRPRVFASYWASPLPLAGEGGRAASAAG